MLINTRAKRISLSLLKWLLSAVMLFYVFRGMDGHAVLNMLTQQDPLVPCAVIALVVTQSIISSYRWQRVVAVLSETHSKPFLSQMVNLNFISAFFNCCLPGTIGGDVIRAMMLRSARFPLSVCANSVILDRLIAVLAIFLMVGIGLPWLQDLLPELPVIEILMFSLLGTAMGLMALFFAPSRLEAHAHHRVVHAALSMLRSLQALVRHPTDLAITTLQAAIGHGCLCVSVFLLADSLGNPMQLADSLLLVPPVLLIAMLPISFGGWGVREVSMVAFLAMAGVPKDVALTISVQMGILTSVGSLPGAWLYLKRKR